MEHGAAIGILRFMADGILLSWAEDSAGGEIMVIGMDFMPVIMAMAITTGHDTIVRREHACTKILRTMVRGVEAVYAVHRANWDFAITALTILTGRTVTATERLHNEATSTTLTALGKADRTEARAHTGAMIGAARATTTMGCRMVNNQDQGGTTSTVEAEA